MDENLQNRIDEQLEVFRNGIPNYELSSEAKLNFGIIKLNPSDLRAFVELYETSDISVEKFVPASGAATRMFKDLLELKNDGKSSAQTDLFFSQAESFPFELKGHNPSQLLREVLDVQQLNLQPKGLIPFHKYGEKIKTPVEEHLVEGMNYAMKNDEVRMHFTVSPEHITEFENHVNKVSSDYSVHFNVTFSTQRLSTDTICVDLYNQLVLDDQGNPIFRPAGHGALLENLNEREVDVVFIKNIDNVVPDRLKGDTISYKKALAGILLSYQERAFDLLRRHGSGEDFFELASDLLYELGVRGPLTNQMILEKLNRPIRVCGMVKNQGEPGGGPFWVKDKSGAESLQIVESAQIDKTDSEQKKIFQRSTHFNPVDLVCGMKNYKGEKFNLMNFCDPEAGFITEKSYRGQPIKALELPGLWNGSMADWNTIFVEVPLTTFNPVKTVNDLLKPEHQETN